mmetsp:Transcript_40861/g.123134  ORF Transcript_40861/g.123134 Transcript_40861/m.123134 type:complete len:904 (-) Transcript_40861:592-3303(-)
MIREGGGNGLWCREDGTGVGAAPPPAAVGLCVNTADFSAPLSPAASFSLISPASTIVEEAEAAMTAAGAPRNSLLDAQRETASSSGVSPRGSFFAAPRPMSPLSPALSPASSMGAESASGGGAGAISSPALDPRLQRALMMRGNNNAAAQLSPRSPHVAAPRLALVRTRVVRCRCLGPPESDWNGRTFRFAEPPPQTQPRFGGEPDAMEEEMTVLSLMGGRRRPHEGGGVAPGPTGGGSDEFVQFADATVSRRHFELRYVSEEELRQGGEGGEGRKRKIGKMSDFGGELLGEDGTDAGGGGLRRLLDGGRSSSGRKKGWFVMRDLGSAGGTFVRIPPGRGARLRPGSMIMLGKHQLVALAVPPPAAAPARSAKGGKCAAVAEGKPNDVDTAAERARNDEREPAAEDYGDANGGAEAEVETEINAADDDLSPELFPRSANSAFLARANAASGSSSSRPLSPSSSSVVAGTDIVTPCYAELRAGEERRRFFFTEHTTGRRRQQHDGSSRGEGEAVTGSIAAVSSSTARAFSARTSASAIDASAAVPLSATPDLNVTMEEGDREDGYGSGGSREQQGCDVEEDNEGDDDKEEDLGVDVSYDDQEDEVEVIAQQDRREEGLDASNRSRGGVMSMTDLGLTLQALSSATTTDGADEDAGESGESQEQEDTGDHNEEEEGMMVSSPLTEDSDNGQGEVSGSENDRANDRSQQGSNNGNNASRRDETPLLILKCFAPEGTPLQNRHYLLTRSGATLGRKATNVISFSHRVGPGDLPPDGGAGGGARGANGAHHQLGAYVGIDSSISGEHARVAYDDDEGVNGNGKGNGKEGGRGDGCLRLYDGCAPPATSSSGGGRETPKGSTNGTWLRLSPMHEASGWFVLEDKMEVLVGTVRFQVEMDEIVVERDIYD